MVSNSLDPDQVRHFVGPDLGPKCLQGLAANDLSSVEGKEILTHPCGTVSFTIK